MNTSKVKIYLISFLVLLKTKEGSSSRSHLPEDCGTTRFDNVSIRIIGGDVAELGQFPWIARIGVISKRIGAVRFFCAGSLINRYFVVTAAHCRSSYFNIVRLGENYLDKHIDCDATGKCAPVPQDIKVKYYTHADYCKKGFENDYGLIELKTPAKINDFVRPICLPKQPIPRKELLNDHVIIAGWGFISSHTRKIPNNLMYISSPVLKDSHCNGLYSTKLTKSQLCIGYEEEKDSCNGDSGGPVVKSVMDNGQRRSYLIGIVSYGMPICGSAPAVYTHVSFYLNWTVDLINKS